MHKNSSAERAMVFIDGSNLFRVLREVSYKRGEPEYRLDYEALKTQLMICPMHEVPLRITRMYYYGSIPDDIKDAQQKYLTKLRHLGIKVKVFPLKRIKETGELKEKGVDVAMTMDLLELAFEDGYDTAILITHDEDFKEVIERVQKKGKRVVLAGYRIRLSNYLCDAADQTVDLGAIWDSLRFSPLDVKEA